MSECMEMELALVWYLYISKITQSSNPSLLQMDKVEIKSAVGSETYVADQFFSLNTL